jgi:hypothetical protein
MVPGIRFRLALVIPVVVALLVAAPDATARTYKWVDQNGTTHYSEIRPRGEDAEVLTVNTGARPEGVAGDDCGSLSCRAGRLESERKERERAAQQRRDEAAKAAAAYPVFPTPVEETDDEKIARLVAACKRSRGSDCDSDEEKRRMLLQNVDLTHAERRALRGFSPAVQRRFLLQRIPKQYRNIE